MVERIIWRILEGVQVDMGIGIELADSTRCIWSYYRVSNHNIVFELVATTTHTVGDIDLGRFLAGSA